MELYCVSTLFWDKRKYFYDIEYTFYDDQQFIRIKLALNYRTLRLSFHCKNDWIAWFYLCENYFCDDETVQAFRIHQFIITTTQFYKRCFETIMQHVLWESLVTVDGYLEDWSNWSTCSQTCGSGFRTRSRACIPPQYGGAHCSQNDRETQQCMLKPCPGSIRFDWNVNIN